MVDCVHGCMRCELFCVEAVRRRRKRLVLEQLVSVPTQLSDVYRYVFTSVLRITSSRPSVREAELPVDELDVRRGLEHERNRKTV